LLAPGSSDVPLDVEEKVFQDQLGEFVEGDCRPALAWNAHGDLEDGLKEATSAAGSSSPRFPWDPGAAAAGMEVGLACGEPIATTIHDMLHGPGRWLSCGRRCVN
jgi:hypothetical protein